MAQAQRKPIEHDARPVEPTPNPPTHPVAADHGYQPGGPVAQLQADLARRLASVSPTTAPVSPAEPLVRFVSVTGGYVLLAAGYAAVAAAIARWW